MRSTQFDETLPFEEKPEESVRRSQLDTLCAIIKRMGYARDNQVRLYGKRFDLLSDPIRIGDDLVFVDATESESGRTTRVRIPRTIVQAAKRHDRAA